MTVVSEIRQVVRRLMRSPMFTVVTLLTIAIGIGANSAVFSVVNGVLLKPLPYPDPGALISVRQTAPRINLKDLANSPAGYFTFREENRTFQQFGVWTGGTVAVTGQAGYPLGPEQVRCLYVTEGTLNALGVRPALGRWFTLPDDDPAAPETAILTYGYWQRKFGGNPAAVGGQLLIDGKPTGVAGVMPQSFRFLDEKPDLILPMRFDRPKLLLGNFSYRGIARLKPGVTLAQANADVARMIPIVNRKFPPPPGFSAKLFEEAGIQAAVRPLKDDVVGELGKVLWVLMGSIGVVLLIACANVANLLLVRAEGRQQELATRMALGASSRASPPRSSPKACSSAFSAGFSGSDLPTPRCASWWRSRPLTCLASKASRSILWSSYSRWRFRWWPASSSASSPFSNMPRPTPMRSCVPADARSATARSGTAPATRWSSCRPRSPWFCSSAPA